MNKPITSTVIKTAIKNLPTNKSPGPDGFRGKFYQKFGEELTPTLLKLSEKCRGRKTPKCILWGFHHPDTKTKQRCHKKRKLHTNITDGEWNGNLLQYSCLANPVDRGAWWAAVHGVAQSRTWLKQLSMHACMHWRRKWQPTPVFLPGESQGQKSLVGCHLWGLTESDMTEVT